MQIFTAIAFLSLLACSLPRVLGAEVSVLVYDEDCFNKALSRNMGFGPDHHSWPNPLGDLGLQSNKRNIISPVDAKTPLERFFAFSVWPRVWEVQQPAYALEANNPLKDCKRIAPTNLAFERKIADLQKEIENLKPDVVNAINGAIQKGRLTEAEVEILAQRVLQRVAAQYGAKVADLEVRSNLVERRVNALERTLSK